MSEGLLIGLVFGLVGLFLGALAFFFFVRTRLFLGRAQKTQGTVINMVYSHHQDGDGGYSPVYRFRTITGQEVVVTDNVSSSPPQFQVGQTIDVFYDPENPQNARINKWFNLYFVPMLLGFMGLVFGGVGIGLGVADLLGYLE